MTEFKSPPRATYREIYQVTFALGEDPNNTVYEFCTLGPPTELKVKKFLSELIKRLQGTTVTLKTGLPCESCLKFQQCLYLLDRFGLILDSDCQCVSDEMCAPFVMGHISTMKVGSVYDIGGQS
jgi:hypothetical protein